MKYFLRDVLFYVLYGLITGVVGFVLDVDSGDAWVLAMVGLVFMAVMSDVNERFPRR